MTINKFLAKWEPFLDSDQHQSFKEDLWTIIDQLGQDRFKLVATQVLSDIPGSELKMYNTPENGVIGWGKRGQVEAMGFIVSYSPAIGEQEYDWYQLLKIIASRSL
jgi:hypothetical protein